MVHASRRSGCCAATLNCVAIRGAYRVLRPDGAVTDASARKEGNSGGARGAFLLGDRAAVNLIINICQFLVWLTHLEFLS